MAVNRPASSTSFKKPRFISSSKGFVILLLTLLILFGGSALWFWYEGKQASRVFDSIAQPDWQIIAIDKYGNRFCDLTCIGQSRTYKAPDVTRENALNIFTLGIEKNSFKLERKDLVCGDSAKSEETSTICSVLGKKGSLYLSIAYNFDDKDDPDLSKTNVSVHFGHDSYLFGLLKEK